VPTQTRIAPRTLAGHRSRPVAHPPAPAEPARPPSQPFGPGRARGVLAGVLVLALAAVAALGLVAVRVRAGDRVEAARDQALAAAADDAVLLLSYDHRHLDRDFAAARAVLTGRFARDYATTTRRVIAPTAARYRAVVRAEVAASSVVRASADRVTVLLFVNQTTTSTRLDGPKVDLDRVRLQMARVGAKWLVRDVQAL